HGQCNQCSSLVETKRERLLHINVAPRLQTRFGNGKMAFRWGAHVNDVRLGLAEHFGQVAKMLLDGKSLGKLPRHEQLPVTNPHNFASLDPLDLRAVVISNLATSHDGSPKHSALHFGRLQSSSLILPRWAPGVSNRSFSVLYCCNKSSSNWRPIFCG